MRCDAVMVDRITTMSGRIIEFPIQKITKSNQGVRRNVESVDFWLVEQARKEAMKKVIKAGRIQDRDCRILGFQVGEIRLCFDRN